jgi:hypothetical protein
MPSTSQPGNPLEAKVGDAIEEFMYHAEELKHHVAKGENTHKGPSQSLKRAAYVLHTTYEACMTRNSGSERSLTCICRANTKSSKSSSGS